MTERVLIDMEQCAFHKRVAPLISGALVLCSAVWFVAAGVRYAHGAFRDGWTAAPLGWILLLTLLPPVCFAWGIILVAARRGSHFRRVERCAFSVASVAVILGTIVAVTVFSSVLAGGR